MTQHTTQKPKSGRPAGPPRKQHNVYMDDEIFLAIKTKAHASRRSVGELLEDDYGYLIDAYKAEDNAA